MSSGLFEKFLKENGFSIKPVKSKESTSTAKEAAKAHNVPVSNIVKSLLIKADDEFIMCLCPGDKKVNLEDLRKKLNKTEVRMANAQEVKEITGHSIGGVPPFGHKTTLKTIILDGFDEKAPLWAAAGASDTNFESSLSQLKKVINTLSK